MTPRRADGAPGLQTRGHGRPRGLKTPGSILISVLLLAISCGTSPVPPAALDTAHEPCGSCRMVISDRHFASQVVAPYEDPKFFDDMGCLNRYLAATSNLPAKAVVYVADHRTAAWVRADLAVYTRVDALTAPMGSHIVAHESTASRDGDQAAANGTALTIVEVFPKGLPGGPR